MQIVSVMQNLAKQLKYYYGNSYTAFSTTLSLMEKATGLSRTEILSNPSGTVTSDQLEQLETLINKLIVYHYPLQYILETVHFLDLTISIRPPILIPRPETE
ncbi:MAG TPA: hypothetical protein VHA52_12620, partial [Candidatus Babeliaceae bacterium]|nr:hypothetical protein [Candidatus Babeliaceae bacterium]